MTEARDQPRPRCGRGGRKAKATFQPTLEALEGRWTPSTLIWKGGISSNPLIRDNWAERRVPTSTDTLIFPANALDKNVQLDGMNSIGGLTLTGSGYKFDRTSSTPLTITSLTASNDAGSNTIDANLRFTDSLQVSTAGGQLVVNGSLSSTTGGTLTKTGAGELLVTSRNSTYTGSVQLVEGVLTIGVPDAVGSGLLELQGGTFQIGPTLSENFDLTNPYHVTGVVNINTTADVSLSGPGVLEDGSALQIANTAGIIRNLGSLSGSGTLRKIGGGTLILDGPAAGPFTGPTEVMDGTVILSREGTEALGGPLVIAAGEVMLDGNDQLADAAPIQVRPGGRLDLHGHSDHIGPLVLQGGTVTTGAGTLGLTTDVTALGGGTSLLAGQVELGDAEHTITTEDNGAEPTLRVTAVLRGGRGLRKRGAGILVFDAPEILSILTRLEEGTMDVNGSQTQATVVITGQAILRGNGTIRRGVLIEGSITVTLSGGRLHFRGGLSVHAQGSDRNLDIDAYVPVTVVAQAAAERGVIKLTNVSLEFDPAAGQEAPQGKEYLLVDNPDGLPIEGTYANLPEGSVTEINGRVYQISYNGGRGRDVVLTRGVRSRLALQSSANPAQAGKPVTLTAAITADAERYGRAPGGQVRFFSGSGEVGTAPVGANGVATLSVQVPSGRYDFRARYEGDGNLLAVESGTLTQTIVEPARDDRSYVDALYRAVLTRPADEGGLGYFARLVTAGKLDRLGDIAGVFVTSVEGRGVWLRQIYTALLGRGPGDAEVSFWVGTLGQGARREQVVAQILGSQEYFDRHAAENADARLAWLRAAYRDLFGRDLDDGGQAFWTAQQNAGLSPTALALALAESAEQRGVLVNQIYEAFLHRSASAGDRGYWAGVIQSGLTDEQVFARIIGSAESYEKNGNEDRTWLSGLYRQLLQRDADAGGLDFFQQVLLTASANNRVAVTTALLTSAEGLRSEVQGIYRSYLRRDGSDNEIGYWVNVRQQGATAEQVQAAILASDEYLQKAGGSIEAWLTRLYGDVLDRAPDDFANNLANAAKQGAAGRQQAALVLLTSEEAQSRLIRGSYRTYLQRDAGASELQYWVGTLRSGARREQVLAALLAAPEYYQRHKVV